MTLMEGGPARVYVERIVSSPLADRSPSRFAQTGQDSVEG
jgi:hypothetical protein